MDDGGCPLPFCAQFYITLGELQCFARLYTHYIVSMARSPFASHGSLLRLLRETSHDKWPPVRDRARVFSHNLRVTPFARGLKASSFDHGSQVPTAKRARQ